jgi:Na+-driven multidrug efflux pump
LPVFFCIFFVLKNELNILVSCAIAFLFTRLIMLFYIIHNKLSLLKRIRTFKIDFVKKIFNFGISISILFFIQKFIEVIALNFLGSKNIEVTSYQMILLFSLIFGLLSNAIATNAFIHIAQNISMKAIYENLVISFFNILLVFSLSMLLIGLNWKLILSFMISDYDLANELNLSLQTIILFIFTQMISVNFVIIIRSMGETWRARIIWCLCMIIGLIFYKNNMEYKIILHITILANFITSFFAIFWIIKNNLYIRLHP